MNRKLFHHLLEFGELYTPQSRQSSSENVRLTPDEGRVGYNNTSVYPTEKERSMQQSGQRYTYLAFAAAILLITGASIPTRDDKELIIRLQGEVLVLQRLPRELYHQSMISYSAIKGRRPTRSLASTLTWQKSPSK